MYHTRSILYDIIYNYRQRHCTTRERCQIQNAYARSTDVYLKSFFLGKFNYFQTIRFVVSKWMSAWHWFIDECTMIETTIYMVSIHIFPHESFFHFLCIKIRLLELKKLLQLSLSVALPSTTLIKNLLNRKSNWKFEFSRNCCTIHCPILSVHVSLSNILWNIQIKITIKEPVIFLSVYKTFYYNSFSSFKIKQ